LAPAERRICDAGDRRMYTSIATLVTAAHAHHNEIKALTSEGNSLPSTSSRRFVSFGVVNLAVVALRGPVTSQVQGHHIAYGVNLVSRDRVFTTRATNRYSHVARASTTRETTPS